jgi:hypothetical protein
MADQHAIRDPLVCDDAKHVGDVERQVDVWMEQMRAFAKSGERRREHLVPARPQPVGDTPPGPAAMPGAVDEEERFRTHVTQFQI